MRIGVVSDTHGGFKNWRRIIEELFKGVDLILHAGDILNHGPRNPLPEGYDPQALAEVINESPIPILVSKGNCDSEVDQMVLDIPVEAPYLILQDNKRRIFLQHGHRMDEMGKVKLGERYRVDLFIFGHTHRPRLERRGDLILLNPGSPSLPFSEDRIPTVALIDQTVVHILSVETGKVLEQLPLRS